MIVPCKTDYMDDFVDDSDFILTNKNIKPKHYKNKIKKEGVMAPTPTPYPYEHRPVAFDNATDIDTKDLDDFLDKIETYNNSDIEKVSIKVKVNKDESKWLDIDISALDSILSTIKALKMRA